MSSKPSSQPSSARSKRDPTDEQPSDGEAGRSGAASRADGAESDGGHLDDDADVEAGEQLDRGLIRRGLSDVQRTADRANFAFTRLDLAGQAVKTLEGELSAYPELRYVNINSNQISDLAPLSALPRLLSLQAAHNDIHSIDAFLATPHSQMQLLQLDHNDIDTLLTRAGVGAGRDAVGAVPTTTKKAAKGGKSAFSSALTANFPSLFALTLSNNKLASLLRPEDSANDFAKDGHPVLQVCV